MERYGPETYGDRIASVYDVLYPPGPDVEEAVEVLAELGRGGRVLELGIGTGRLAIPLAARGIDIAGVDASESMLAQLRAKPGGQDIPVTLADFAQVPAAGPFQLIFVAFNTFFALMSQESQLRCLQAAAERLAPGGAVVLEVFVPDPTRYDRGQRVAASHLAGDWVLLETAVHDPVAQRVRLVHALISAEGSRMFPLEVRYAWPAELDLMARLAGLRLRDRWSGWGQEPFTAASERHVSVYVPQG